MKVGKIFIACFYCRFKNIVDNLDQKIAVNGHKYRISFEVYELHIIKFGLSEY